jgi:HK97 family phage portal protein
MSLLRKSESRALPTSIDLNQVTARPLYQNWSGEIVNELNAFTTSSIVSSVTLLSDSVALMPLKVTQHNGIYLQELPLPAWMVKPNAEETMYDFVHQTIATLAIHGVAFIYCPRNGMDVLELRNIHPDRVQVIDDPDQGIVYKVGRTTLTSAEVIQIDWLKMPNQLRGVSPLDSLRNTIGTNIAIDRFLSAFYGDGATPSSVLETDQALTETQAQVLRDTWVDSLYKRRRPAVLSGGLKWRPISASASDMETMALRESVIRDVARTYRIPLHMIHASGGDTQTYNNIEAAGLNFVRYTLLPWMRRLESALNSLLPPNQEVHFDSEEFERADQMTRVRAQQAMIMSGTLTPNEARAIENREPYDGGDQFILGVPGAPMAGVAGGELPTLGIDSVTTQ